MFVNRGKTSGHGSSEGWTELLNKEGGKDKSVLIVLLSNVYCLWTVSIHSLKMTVCLTNKKKHPISGADAFLLIIMASRCITVKSNETLSAFPNLWVIVASVLY